MSEISHMLSSSSNNSAYTFLAELKRLPQEQVNMQANTIQTKEMLL